MLPPVAIRRLPAAAVLLARLTVPVVPPAVSLVADWACCAVDNACCEQAGQAGEAVIGGAEGLLGLPDLVEQGAEIVRPIVQ